MPCYDSTGLIFTIFYQQVGPKCRLKEPVSPKPTLKWRKPMSPLTRPQTVFVLYRCLLIPSYSWQLTTYHIILNHTCCCSRRKMTAAVVWALRPWSWAPRRRSNLVALPGSCFSEFDVDLYPGYFHVNLHYVEFMFVCLNRNLVRSA